MRGELTILENGIIDRMSSEKAGDGWSSEAGRINMSMSVLVSR